MSIENEGSLEPDSAKSDIKKVTGYLLLSVALVILPSQLTSKRVEVKSPHVAITLGQLEPTADAASLQDLVKDTPVVVPEPAPEPPQAVVVPEVIPTPPPVVQEPVEPPVAPKPTPKDVPANISGSKLEWLAASNIPRKDWDLADWLIRRESSWNPAAQNPNSSAFGLKQFLDGTWAGAGCSKAEAIGNPVYQLNCGQKYVIARYSGWQGAIEFWRVHHWY